MNYIHNEEAERASKANRVDKVDRATRYSIERFFQSIHYYQ